MEEGVIVEQIREKYFSGSRCRMHDNYSCERCEAKCDQEVERKNKEEKQRCDLENAKTCAPAPIVLVTTDINSDAASTCRKARSIEFYSKQLELIQTVFGWSDEKMSKIKVTEIDSLAKKAQKEATVGHMNKMLQKPSWFKKLVCKIS